MLCYSYTYDMILTPQKEIMSALLIVLTQWNSTKKILQWIRLQNIVDIFHCPVSYTENCESQYTQIKFVLDYLRTISLTLVLL
jgi:hypothetical protein